MTKMTMHRQATGHSRPARGQAEAIIAIGYAVPIAGADEQRPGR